jgi:hypothetical protein
MFPNVEMIMCRYSGLFTREYFTEGRRGITH